MYDFIKYRPIAKKLSWMIALILPGAFFTLNCFSQNINLQFSDTSATVNSFINIPVKVTTTLTGRGVLSYSLQYSFSQAYLSVQGVVTTGTISNAFGTPTVNMNQPGLITIAGAGSSPLSGTGNFIYLRFRILAAGTTTLANTGPDYNYFNEGDPVMAYLNNCQVSGIPLPSINISPNTAIVLKNETQQFTASGGTAPYTWSTLDPSTATISSSGLLTGSQVGITTVKAVDFQGYSGLSGAIDIRGYRLSIPDTAGVYNTFMNIPVRVTNLSGLNVLSGTFTITYNPSYFSNIQVLTTNSLLQNISPPVVNLTVPGVIQLSFASASYLTNAGVLFWIRGHLSNITGGNSTLAIQSGYFNEGLLPIVQNGSVSYVGPPAININPNSGQLVYNDSLVLAVNGPSPMPPFNWSVSDTNLASINSNGVLKARRSGQVTVSVTDGNGSSATSDFFQLSDTYLKIADTTAIAGAQVDLPVTLKALPAGEGVLSIQGRIITSNPGLFNLTDIITAGTATASFSISSVTGTGFIQFAMAGVTPVPGNSILFKVRGTVNAAVQVGQQSLISTQNLLLNEGVPLPFILNGTLTEIPAPVTYTFIGNGNWDIVSNWQNNQIPPANLQGSDQIIIDPVNNGECVLNIFQHLSPGTKITINTGKKFRILSFLNISH